MIRQMPERRGPTRAGRHVAPNPGQAALPFPPAPIVTLTPTAAPSNLFARALLLDYDGRADAAKSAYLAAIERGQHVADAHCNLGIISAASGRTEEALLYFSKALQEDPAHTATHHNAGMLFDDLGMAPAARMHYEIALALEPSAASCFNLALLLESQGADEDAVSILDHGLALGLDREEGLLAALRRRLCLR